MYMPHDSRHARLYSWWLLGLLMLLLRLVIPSLSDAAVYYVAQQGGSDTNSGSTDAPFATIQHCASTAVSGDFCLIRTGTYRETVTPAADHVTYAPDGASAIVTVSGADVVTGWTVSSGTIYKSRGMTWTMGVGNDQVFVDGRMMNLARWPNTSLDVSHPIRATSQDYSPHTYNGDTEPWVLTDTNLPHVNLVGAEVSFQNGYPVTSGIVTSQSGNSISFTNFAGVGQRVYETPCGGQCPYWLSNLLVLLDTAGEWYFDGTSLFLWTPNGDSPTTHTVEAKHRMWGFDLRGRSNVTIQNIHLFATSITTDSHSANNILDGIQGQYVWHQLRLIPPAPIAALAQGDGLWGSWESGIQLNGHDNILRNCTLAYSSGHGAYLHGTHQTVTNCVIHDFNYFTGEGGGVAWYGEDPSHDNDTPSQNTHRHVATWNTMYNGARHGLSHYYADGVTVSHNIIHDVCLQTDDCGITYHGHLGGSGTIDHNLFFNNHAGTFVNGIYLDQTASNWLVHHNVVYQDPAVIHADNSSTAIPMTANPANNQVYNNTLWNWGIGLWNKEGGTNIQAYNTIYPSGAEFDCTDCQNNLSSNNPPFVNATGGNFQLQASASGAINQGRVISGITDGFVGSAPDIGAYEFGVPPWTAGANHAPTPTASLVGTSTATGAILTWLSTNATSCTALAGAGFTTNGATANSAGVPVTSQSPTTYVLTCTGAGGTSSPASVTVRGGTPVSLMPPSLLQLLGTP